MEQLLVFVFAISERELGSGSLNGMILRLIEKRKRNKKRTQNYYDVNNNMIDEILHMIMIYC